MRTVWLVSIVLMAQGCSCSGTVEPVRGAACTADGAPEGCGQECGTGMAACPAGLYCGADATCTADCGAGTGVECGGGYFCASDGRCTPERRPDSSIDANNLCAAVRLETRQVTPTVIVIVDQSGSMTASFGGGTRWTVLRDSLLARPGGLIFALQSQVRFGLALYSARSRDGGSGGPPIGECPLITSVPPALDNYPAINGVYAPADPIEDTPTGDAIDAVLAILASEPDPGPDPIIFIVATDGEPDRCEELDPQNGQAEAIAAADRAYARGIRTFMISVGMGVVSAAHLQDMANAGLGRTAGDPPADYWVAGDDVGLRDALATIVGGVLSCQVELSGMIDVADACTGSVLLNGMPLRCDDPDGWRPVDSTHIEILGMACDRLTGGMPATLEASFPCDVILI